MKKIKSRGRGRRGQSSPKVLQRRELQRAADARRLPHLLLLKYAEKTRQLVYAHQALHIGWTPFTNCHLHTAIMAFCPQTYVFNSRGSKRSPGIASQRHLTQGTVPLLEGAEHIICLLLSTFPFEILIMSQRKLYMWFLFTISIMTSLSVEQFIFISWT